jgi:site-specific recombinase XerD
MAEEVEIRPDGNNMLQSSFGIIADKYRSSLEASNRSPKTVSWYMEILHRFFYFIESQNIRRPIRELGREDLRAYIRYLQNARRWPGSRYIREDKGRLSPYSIQGHVRAIKAFWGWLSEEGYVERNPLAKFPLPKVPENLIRIITPEQFTILLTHIDKATASGAKYFCILLLLYDTGIRISELIKLEVKGIDLRDSLIRVMGKGRKERVVPLSYPTRNQIAMYLQSFRRRICPEESPYVFANPEGEAISVNSVQQFLRRLAKRSGLEKVRVSPHIFRHTFATQYLANGGNALYLREIMGHKSLLTTLKYTHLQARDLQKQHMKFSPVMNLGILRGTSMSKGATTG